MAEGRPLSVTVEQAQALDWAAARHRCELKVFGSFATGAAHADSDIDILICAGVPAERELHRLAFLLTALFLRKVDLVPSAKLFPFLRERILDEARSAQQLAAGLLAPTRPKSPYYYLYIIQNELHALRRLPVGTARLQRLAMLRASKVVHFYRQRFLACGPTAQLPQAPHRSLRALARIHSAWLYTEMGERQAVAEARRLARHMSKRLSISPDVVRASVLAEPSSDS